MRRFIDAWVQELTDDEFDCVVSYLHLKVTRISDFRQATFDVPHTEITVFYQTGKTGK